MNEGICVNCKWWSKMTNGATYCDLTEVEYGEPCHPTSKASSSSSEYYNCWLRTAPDFGCVQFESKEDE